jgi:hypothetical protein
MTNRTRRLPVVTSVVVVVVALALAPIASIAQSTPGQAPDRATPAPSASAAKQDRWLHVRVENPDS